ncbi:MULTISPECIES: hypothetical protein [unclassified Streptomyces]|uniref:hypothetical protein n=1 Tax=unclassified Streptomyces TaxID=2593676 RepID=UPI00070B7CDA|nr:hypothetical protein [Streptomyces sp. Root1310]KQX71103.1 hypothetical protein ASD48_11905 [Streptomyces sp. Root1310]
METMTCGCGEDRIPGVLARGILTLALTGPAVMALTACVLGGVLWAVTRWRDRARPEPEESFFDGFGRWEEEQAEPPLPRGGGS